ncbi:unnamed protein product [Microthlaspi erraticum]|uniref:Uncharacterized protein n=1 Tax=Microthlaspi erraticum TaxID=1685480 RepID=A0A6D2I250_9BRAS|nr:unnamed protein product [Microthlaspi erraticum]
MRCFRSRNWICSSVFSLSIDIVSRQPSSYGTLKLSPGTNDLATLKTIFLLSCFTGKVLCLLQTPLKLAPFNPPQPSRNFLK